MSDLVKARKAQKIADWLQIRMVGNWWQLIQAGNALMAEIRLKENREMDEVIALRARVKELEEALSTNGLRSILQSVEKERVRRDEAEEADHE